MSTNAIINSTTLSGLMYPGKNILKVAYKLLRKVHDQYYDRFDTQQREFISWEQIGSSSARETAEGEDSYIGTLKNGGQKTFLNKNYTIGFNFSRQVLQDNLYADQAPQILKNLLMSQIDCQNVQATKPLNYAYSSNPQYLCWDNMPAASNQHKAVDMVDVSNTLSVPAPFNEDTYWELLTKMVNMVQPSGLKLDSLWAVGIIANPILIRQLDIILNSPTRPGVSSMEKNPSKGTVDNYYINRYLQSNMYIIRTNEEGLRYINRDDFNIGQNPWYSSWTILVASIMRYCFGIDNYRCAFFGKSAPVGNM